MFYITMESENSYADHNIFDKKNVICNSCQSSQFEELLWNIITFLILLLLNQTLGKSSFCLTFTVKNYLPVLIPLK